MLWRRDTQEKAGSAQFCERGGRVSDCRELALETQKEQALRARAVGGWRLV